ncbi:MAG: cation diffusion facilitator family transporter [Luteibaculaceae bacterium]
MVKSKTLIQFQSRILFFGAVIMLVKVVAWLVTNSNAILTDALESLVNIGAGLMSLYALKLSSLPKDENHPYGHGKIEFITVAIEGSLISIAGVFIFLKALYNIFYPEEISAIDIGIYLTVITGLGNFLLGYFSEKAGKEHKSIVLISAGKHLKSDAYSSLGLIIGLAIVLLTNLPILDNFIAILFGSFIAFTGIKLVRNAISGIMDEADFELIEVLVAKLQKNRAQNWIDIHNLRVIKYGAQLHVDCHVTLPWYYSVKQSHDAVEAIETVVKNTFGKKTELFVHVDPCMPESCKICQVQDCKVRQEEFKGLPLWNKKNLTKNKKHHY